MAERLTREGIAALCRAAGFPEASVPTAVAVALAESGGDPLVVRVNAGGTAPGSRDRGLFQINDYWHAEVSDECALDPDCATREALRLSSGGTNWNPWNAYKNGAYLRYLEEEEATAVLKRVRVLLQAGHGPPGSGGGGAPGEAEWAWALAPAIAARLVEAGVEVLTVGGWLINGREQRPPGEVEEDYDLFVSLHYDAAVYGAGRNTGAFADRAARDPMGAESDRAIRCWEAVYFPATHLRNATERRNANTRDYYAFRATSERTPGIIVEHGVGAPVPSGGYPPGEDAALLHEGADLIAALDAAAILDYLGVEERADVAISAEDRAILDVMRGLGADASSITGWINEIGALREMNRQQSETIARLQEQSQQAGAPAEVPPRQVTVHMPSGAELGYVPEG